MTQTSVAQPDSVLLAFQSNLLGSDIQIIVIDGEWGIRERYNYVKGMHWFLGIDTLLMVELTKSDFGYVDNSFKEPLLYHMKGSCDSLVNLVKNDVYHREISSTVWAHAQESIGSDNREFHHMYTELNSRLPDVHSKCQMEFASEISKYQSNIFTEIKRIRAGKELRLSQFKNDPQSISQKQVSELFQSFSNCEPDYRSLEIVILHKPAEFFWEMEKLESQSFSNLIGMLGGFPVNTDVETLKLRLKSVKTCYLYKWKIIRSLKTSVKKN